MNFVQANVTSYASLLAAFKSAISFNPRKTLDVVLPFAGLMGGPIFTHLADAPTTEDPSPPPITILDVNIKGVYYTTHLALHYFRQSPDTEKNLVFISSLLAYITPPGCLDYAGSKGAVRGLFHSLRYASRQPSLGLPNLRTNLIAPNLIETPMSADMLPYLENERGFAVGQPSDIVDIALRILCDKTVEGRAITGGKDLAVDLCDDMEGLFASRECRKLIEGGVLGRGPSKTGFFNLVD
jgi:5'-hydroxyaverantin dehydrogenase